MNACSKCCSKRYDKTYQSLSFSLQLVLVLVFYLLMLSGKEILLEQGLLSFDEFLVKDFITSLSIGCFFLIVLCWLVNHWYWSDFKKFITLMVLSFACSEVQLVVIHYLSFAIRLSCIAVLLVNSLLIFDKKRLDVIHYIAFFLLFLVFVSIARDSFLVSDIVLVPSYLVLCIGLILGVSKRCRVWEDILGVFLGVFYSAVALCLLHLIALVFYDNAFLEGRFRSFYSLPTNFANNYIIILSVLSVFILVLRRDTALALNIRYVKFYSVTTYVLLFLSLALILMSGTRNAIVCFLLLFMVLCANAKNRIPASYFLYPILLLPIVFFIEIDVVHIDAVVKRFSLYNNSVEIRFELWKELIQLIENKPWFGYGLSLSGLHTSMDTYQNLTLSSWNAEDLAYVNDAHNMLLGVWLKLGFLGVISFLSLYIISLLSAWRLFKILAVNKEHRYYLMFPILVLSVLFFAGLFEENLAGRGSLQQVFFGLSIGLLIALKRLVVTSKVYPHYKVD